VCGAFRPATGEKLTAPDRGRTIANWVDFRDWVDAWLYPATTRVSAVPDNLATHRALDVLLWEIGFQPTAAADLNLIEPWRKVRHSLAIKGRRFESWEEVCRVVVAVTADWNAHRHPFVWGRRKRRRADRRAGLAHLPLAASTW
jgi:hypothetical protein